MSRKIRTTLSGRQEEVWFTDNDGLMGAYDLKDWYQGLPYEIQEFLIHLQSSLSGSMMLAWEKEKITTGEYEVHHPIIEKFAWRYSTVPPLLSTLFHWSFRKDTTTTQLILDEWLNRAKKTKSPGAKYMAYCAAIEFYWQTGYTGAKVIRSQGLHNDELKQVKQYADAVVKLLRGQKIPLDIENCKPLDRLFLLYKLTVKKELALALIDELESLGYQFFELTAYKNEFLK